MILAPKICRTKTVRIRIRNAASIFSSLFQPMSTSFKYKKKSLQQPGSQGVGGRPELQSTKIPQKIATSKKVEQGRSFGVNFDICLVKHALKNRCEKLRRKTCQKTWKLSKKTGTILSPKKKILKFLLQRRILENSVFTREKQCFLKIPCFESVHTFEKRPRKK